MENIIRVLRKNEIRPEIEYAISGPGAWSGHSFTNPPVWFCPLLAPLETETPPCLLSKTERGGWKDFCINLPGLPVIKILRESATIFG